jgi:hypothetical protein
LKRPAVGSAALSPGRTPHIFAPATGSTAP